MGDSEVELAQLPLETLKSLHPNIGSGVYEVLNEPRSTLKVGARYPPAEPRNDSVKPPTVHCVAVQTVAPKTPGVKLPVVENVTTCPLACPAAKTPMAAATNA